MENHIKKFPGALKPEDCARQQGHRAAVFWLTGLSGSGKSTIAHAVEKKLFDLGVRSFVFDGDNVRHGLCTDLGFSPEDRSENIRRIAETCKLFVESGTICICAFVSPLQSDRSMVHSIVGDVFHEIHIECPVEVCEKRDVKGYYKLAREGIIQDYTGISAPYEAPLSPQLCLSTDLETVELCTNRTLQYILASTKIAHTVDLQTPLSTYPNKDQTICTSPPAS